MEPTTIQAPQIQIGDRIRCTTADQVTHELLVGRVEHREYLVRPVQPRSSVTILDLSPRDVVTLLDRAPSQSELLETLAFAWAKMARDLDPQWPNYESNVRPDPEVAENEGHASGLRSAAGQLLEFIGRGAVCTACGNLTEPNKPCINCGEGS
jgi:hypothetical protein